MFPNVAFVFPGQGSQVSGMGKEIADAYSAARQTFEQADDLLGFPLSRLCFEGPDGSLNDTLNTQPALYTCGVAVLRALHSERAALRPAAAAGHSLGEFTALVAAGALDFADGLRLVRERGALMKAAGERTPGAMAAVLGLDTPSVQRVCLEISEALDGVLVVANDNCPGQVVVSGDVASMEAAAPALKAAGAKKVVRLAVSIAAHSPIMEPAAAEFRHALSRTAFRDPEVPIYGNTTAAPLTSADEIRHELDGQLTQPVRWTETIQAMTRTGISHFIELGSKDVLSGLIRRIDTHATATPVYNVQTLTALLEMGEVATTKSPMRSTKE